VERLKEWGRSTPGLRLLIFLRVFPRWERSITGVTTPWFPARDGGHDLRDRRPPRVLPGSPFGDRAPAADLYEQMFAGFAGGIRQAGGFTEPERWRFGRQRTCTRQEWLDLLPTTGGLTRLPPDRLAQVLEEVGAAIDALGGSFTMTAATLAVAAKRT